MAAFEAKRRAGAGQIEAAATAACRLTAALFGFSLAVASTAAAQPPLPSATKSVNAKCTAPIELVKLAGALPRLATAVKNSEPLVIVALGSSSTFGTGATSRDKAYPARLERELRTAWPRSRVTVINAGIGGQLVTDMRVRIDRDVLIHKPQLVLWQTGVNDAIRGVPLAEFRTEMDAGIERLRSAGADVVLIDQQFYPGFAKVRNGDQYLRALKDAGDRHGAPVVQRYRIMQHLLTSAQFTTETLLSADKFHLNDRSYDCIGHLLAQSLEAAVRNGDAKAVVVGGAGKL